MVATVVTDNISEEPIVLNLQKFEEIDDDTCLELGPSGVAMYRNQKKGDIPRFIDYRILIFDSDEDIRDAGKLIEEIQSDEQYNPVKNKVVEAITAANPTVGLTIEAANMVIGIIAKVLKSDEAFKASLMQSMQRIVGM